MKKVIAIIDCQLLFLSAREEFGPLARLDYVKLKNIFHQDPEDKVDAIIYILASPYHTDNQFLKFLKKNNYIIMRKFAKVDLKGEKKEILFKNKSWTDTMVWEAMKMLPNYDEIFVVSGNGAFCSVVNAAHDQSKKVTVVAFKNSLQETLKKLADNVIFLDKEYIFDSTRVQKSKLEPVTYPF